VTDSGSGPDRPIGRAAIFLLTVGVLLLEIASTRIFSFSLWYHFTYVAISVALLGFGASGTLLATSSWLARMPADRLLAKSMLLSAAGAVVLLLTIAFIRVEPFAIARDPGQLLRLVLVFVLCSVPFLTSGMALAVAFRVTTSPNGVYFADLLGAGAGCALAVGAIWVFGSPGTVALSSVLFVGAALMAAPPRQRIAYGAAGAAMVVAAVATAVFVPLRPSPEKLLAKMMAAGVEPSYSRWSPIFRVDVYPEPVPGASGSRGLSPKYKGPASPRVKYVSHDGYAEAPMYQFSGDDNELDFLAHSLSAAPYQVASKPSVLIIGLGGGFDVLNARRNGAGKVKGIELDPLTVEIVKNIEADFNGHILQAPNVDVIPAEGRSFLRHSPERWDLIQMTEVDTLAAMSSGAYMLAESYLNTRESMTEYLEHLAPGGTLSILMADLPWKNRRARFSLRHLMNFIGATERLGIEKPSDHAAILAHPPYLEMMLKREPWSPGDIETLRQFAEREGFEVWHLPGQVSDTPYAKLLGGTPAEREQFLDDYPLNVRATTDDRPFFFHHYRWKDLLSSENWEFDGGIVLATGQVVLAAILLVSLVSSIVLIIGPLLGKAALRGHHAGRFGLYFSSLGLGFMFIEISLIQRFILFLGHPTYSVAVILLALLSWTGVGAYLSGRLGMHPKRIIGLAFVALVVLIGFYAWIVPAFFSYWLGSSAAWRYALTIILLFPLGLVLGVFFPAGILLVREHDELLVPWAWGANGAASVVGSILSIVLALSIGFQGVLYAAGLVYLAGIAALFSVRSPAGAR
jgi:SAM-dependent methyltransferase